MFIKHLWPFDFPYRRLSSHCMHSLNARWLLCSIFHLSLTNSLPPSPPTSLPPTPPPSLLPSPSPCPQVSCPTLPSPHTSHSRPTLTSITIEMHDFLWPKLFVALSPAHMACFASATCKCTVQDMQSTRDCLLAAKAQLPLDWLHPPSSLLPPTWHAWLCLSHLNACHERTAECTGYFLTWHARGLSSLHSHWQRSAECV